MTIAFLAAQSAAAQEALKQATQRYGQNTPEAADVVVALGGDGFLLQTLHTMLPQNKPVYGMKKGSVGFLLNSFDLDDLPARLNNAQRIQLHPLHMNATTVDGQNIQHSAFNEVSLLRETHQAAKIKITVDEVVRMAELVCDGALVATAAGSTAYNLSAHGPILPLNANLLALTPISAFRPRRWRGALLPSHAHIRFDILDAAKRPVSAVADFNEVRDVRAVAIHQNRDRAMTLLFDPDQNLAERIIQEQFEV